MKKKQLLSIVSLLILLLTGCSQKQIKLVKKSSFPGYQETTVETFLKKSNEITNIKWSYDENDKGIKYVALKAKIVINNKQLELFNDAFDAYVEMQFIFSADEKEFYQGYSGIVLNNKNNKLKDVIDLKETSSICDSDLSSLLSRIYSDKIHNRFLELQEYISKSALESNLISMSLENLKKLEEYNINIQYYISENDKSYAYEFLAGAIAEKSSEKIQLLKKIGFDFNEEESLKIIFSDSYSTDFRKYGFLGLIENYDLEGVQFIVDEFFLSGVVLASNKIITTRVDDDNNLYRSNFPIDYIYDEYCSEYELEDIYNMFDYLLENGFNLTSHKQSLDDRILYEITEDPMSIVKKEINDDSKQIIKKMSVLAKQVHFVSEEEIEDDYKLKKGKYVFLID